MLINFFRLRYFITLAISALFFAQPVTAHAQVLSYMPPVGTMISQSPQQYDLPYLVGMRFQNEDMFNFTFVLNRGNVASKEDILRLEVDRIGKYFLAALTIPEDDLWVNLSPYEKDAVITPELAQTDLGKDLLGEDYVLKQLASSLTHPDTEAGRNYWQAIGMVGKNNFQRVWIVPGAIKIKESSDRVAITEATFDVLTEDDYVARRDIAGQREQPTAEDIKAAKAFKQYVLPILKKEVNTGKHFAQLRQLYRAVILAGWFKKKLKDTVLSRLYFDQKKINGVENNDPQMKDKIYNEYIKAFNQGVYNIVKSERSSSRLTKRQYFSGGEDLLGAQSGPQDANQGIVMAQFANGGSNEVDTAQASAAGGQPFEADVLTRPVVDEAYERALWVGKVQDEWKNGRKYILVQNASTGRRDEVTYSSFMDNLGEDALTPQLMEAIWQAHDFGGPLSQYEGYLQKLEPVGDTGFYTQKEDEDIGNAMRMVLGRKVQIIVDAAKNSGMDNEQAKIFAQWFTDRLLAGKYDESDIVDPRGVEQAARDKAREERIARRPGYLKPVAPVANDDGTDSGVRFAPVGSRKDPDSLDDEFDGGWLKGKTVSAFKHIGEINFSSDELLAAGMKAEDIGKFQTGWTYAKIFFASGLDPALVDAIEKGHYIGGIIDPLAVERQRRSGKRPWEYRFGAKDYKAKFPGNDAQERAAKMVPVMRAAMVVSSKYPESNRKAVHDAVWAAGFAAGVLGLMGIEDDEGGPERVGGARLSNTQEKSIVYVSQGGLKLSSQKAADYLAKGKVSGMRMIVTALRY